VVIFMNLLDPFTTEFENSSALQNLIFPDILGSLGWVPAKLVHFYAG
jgi:hypothetical protein